MQEFEHLEYWQGGFSNNEAYKKVDKKHIVRLIKVVIEGNKFKTPTRQELLPTHHHF